MSKDFVWSLKTASKLVVAASFNVLIYSFKKYLLSAFYEASAVNIIANNIETACLFRVYTFSFTSHSRLMLAYY